MSLRTPGPPRHARTRRAPQSTRRAHWRTHTHIFLSYLHWQTRERDGPNFGKCGAADASPDHGRPCTKRGLAAGYLSFDGSPAAHALPGFMQNPMFRQSARGIFLSHCSRAQMIGFLCCASLLNSLLAHGPFTSQSARHGNESIVSLPLGARPSYIDNFLIVRIATRSGFSNPRRASPSPNTPRYATSRRAPRL